MAIYTSTVSSMWRNGSPEEKNITYHTELVTLEQRQFVQRLILLYKITVFLTRV